jgi:fatty acid desaturase
MAPARVLCLPALLVVVVVVVVVVVLVVVLLLLLVVVVVVPLIAEGEAEGVSVEVYPAA